MNTGTIVKISPKGFGFIAVDGQKDHVFFHAKQLVELEFDAALQERRVKFLVVSSPNGPRAVQVQAAN